MKNITVSFKRGIGYTRKYARKYGREWVKGALYDGFLDDIAYHELFRPENIAFSVGALLALLTV